jgi:two-component system cell cycle sensor histidine kinase/response regulator CckA
MAVSEGSQTILIVDDEEMVRSIATQMLEKLGYQVVAAASGAEAIEEFERDAGRFDLVILDMVMPGINGSEVFDKIKALDSSIKCILSSGYSRDSQADAIMKRGCDAFIQKPFRLQDLSHLITSLIGS